MKKVIVTGDSKGLGNNICKKLLDKRFQVLGISRSESEGVEEIREDFPEKYSHINFDLSNTGKIKRLYNEKIKDLGPIYGLVNNAAFAYDDIITNADVETAKYMMDVNVNAAIILSKFVIRDMILNDTEGSIVHVSSVSTVTGYTGLSMYGATKGALEALSLGIAREWGRKGIRSNCVAPGFMDTEMTSTLSDEQREQVYSRTSLKEATSKESVAEATAFLLSEASKSITGETIRIDAGTL
jgi:3-oxoacyl-[acyl-carrier protein] reductase